MRFLADTNVTEQAVRALRAAGHDVVHVAERAADPGDAVLLAEAVAEDRIFMTKDHDIGVLVHRDRHAHRGVLLINDLGDPAAETILVLSVLSSHGADLHGRAVLRAGEAGVRARGSE